MDQEFISLLINNGIGIGITILIVFGLFKGIPKGFTWLGEQWDDLKGVLKNYLQKQTDSIEKIGETCVELSSTNKELVGIVNVLSTRMDNVEQKIDEIDEKMDTLMGVKK